MFRPSINAPLTSHWTEPKKSAEWWAGSAPPSRPADADTFSSTQHSGLSTQDSGLFMRIGTYYYPEQWPRDQWERDFDHIASMGLQIVHMGEFAWFTMEPRPGEIQLDWLE